MKRLFTRVFIFFSLFIIFASAHAGQLYNCIDSDGNKVVTDSPRDGMKDCVVKDSYPDPSPKENAKQPMKYNKGKWEPQSKEDEKRTEKEREAAEKEEAALMQQGHRCYTEQLNIISGGSVSDVVFWRICKDKDGKIVSRRRL